MPLPWPAALLPEGLIAGLAMAVAASCVGGWLGARLATDRTPSLRGAAVAGAVAIFALTAYGLRLERVAPGCAGRSTVDGARSSIVRADVPTTRTGSRPPPGRAAGWWSNRLERGRAGRVPHDAADPARRRVEDDDPPALRPHAERAAGLPARRPGDPGRRRPAPSPSSRASFGPEQQLLQRERKTGVAGWLWAVGVRRRAGDRARVPRRAGVGRAPRLARPRPDLTLPVGHRARARRCSSAIATAPTSSANPRRNSDCGTRSANVVPSSAPRRWRAPASR